MLHTLQFKEAFECPMCGDTIFYCEISGCNKFAEYEGWTGHDLLRRTKVCEQHFVLTKWYHTEIKPWLDMLEQELSKEQ